MTEAQFVRNHRGIDQGEDPAKELLEGMYRRIKVRESCRHIPPQAVALRDLLPPCNISGLFFCGPVYSPARRRIYKVGKLAAATYVHESSSNSYFDWLSFSRRRRFAWMKGTCTSRRS